MSTLSKFTIRLAAAFLWIAVIFSGHAVSAQGSWEKVAVPTRQYLKAVCFTDSLRGWISGDSGIILHTNDGGNSWIRQETSSTNSVEFLFFLNGNEGWASSFNYTTLPYGTILLKTTDGGEHWIPHPYPNENIFITCILMRDSLHGWMGGKPHALVKTSDGGITWTQAVIDTSTLAFFPVLAIAFYNDQYGYASGGMFDIAGVTWHTSNGGDMWYAIDAVNAPADEIHGLHVFDSTHVMGAGGDQDFGYGVGIIRTSDGGLNWDYEELGIQGNAFDIDFRNQTEAWAPLGPRQKLMYSLDAGTTWTAILTPGATSIYKMNFPDSLHGYAVGKEGAFLRYHPPVVPGTADNLVKQGFVLEQNFPNPVEKQTTFRYTIPETDFPNRERSITELVIYNIYGEAITSIPCSEMTAGSHELTFDASGTPPGVYFCYLRWIYDGETCILNPSRKMVILSGQPCR